MQQSLKSTQHISWIPQLMGWVAAIIKFVERTAGPIVDLVIRLWLARIFFVSAVIKLSNWDNALLLSQNEYPVSWLNPISAAYLGVSIELIGAVLLAIGLATRFAALSLFILSLIIQFNYIALDQHLFWAALFGWFVVRGAGPLSIDAMLGHGLTDSALPLAAQIIKSLKCLSKFGSPFYLFLLRLWLAAAIYFAFQGQVHYADILPITTAANFGSYLGLILALMLVTGIALRWVGLVTIIATPAMMMLNMNLDNYWIFALLLLAIYGAGCWSMDYLISHKLRKIYPQLDGKPAFSLEGLPHVVIVGAGFGGLACAAKLAKQAVQITLVDRHNYHLFQPLLYQVATAALGQGDIASPTRGMFRDFFNVRVLLGNVIGVDSDKNELIFEDHPLKNQRIQYDYLVLATGASHSYFGRDDWAKFAPGLKRIEDATEVRRRLLLAFELAEATSDPMERESLLTFLIVGGGPTGVELAGAIAELARFGMEKEFRGFDPANARVLLVQSGSRLLPAFDENLSKITLNSLTKIGVEVHLNSKVEHIDAEGVMVSGKRIPSRTVLWAAGVMASPAADWLNAEKDKSGRVKVGADLSVIRHSKIFAIGDTALSNGWNGEPVPGLAPAAKQGGEYVAKVIMAKVLGKHVPAPFRYTHLGSLATIGRKAAVADFGFMKLSGAPAWWLWGFIHLTFLVGLRNRFSVMFDWFWAYLTLRSGTRIITGSEAEHS
ncbi:MAG: quinol oxidase [Proteobacteria bacterium ST_bin12]|nr:MAG: quinol oxidase [Proteobacteria bacterium ST_bin12]